MAQLLFPLGSQNRQSFQTSFKRTFHSILLHNIEVQEPFDTSQEEKKPRPYISKRETKSLQRRS